jgi:hypothetical protein
VQVCNGKKINYIQRANLTIFLKMTDAKDALKRVAYPFVNAKKMEQFVGSTVALVGRVEKIEGQTLTVKTTDGKSRTTDL